MGNLFDEAANAMSGEKQGMEFEKVVDKVVYVHSLYADGYKQIEARKTGSVKVRRVSEKERLITYSQGGIIEADETVNPGSYILMKVERDGTPIVDEYFHTNCWQASAETLLKKYDVSSERDIVNGMILQPKGGMQKFVFVNRNITIMVPWGENGSMIPQNIERGGVLNVTDENDIYGVSSRDFKDTYEIIKREE